MKKAVSYIHENYHRDLNMATVSNHVSLNYSYFSQTFKEFTGESFVVYLKRVRIRKAKALLEETDVQHLRNQRAGRLREREAVQPRLPRAGRDLRDGIPHEACGGSTITARPKE